MDKRLYLRHWLWALTLYERKLIGPVAYNRNAFIRSAADEYLKHQTVPAHLRYSHQLRIENLLVPHYRAVMPYFGALATNQFKSRRVRQEVKRLTFLSLMQDWVAQRALKQATTISDTDYNDVQDAINTGVTEGLGVSQIATRIKDVTGLTAFRAATVARTETHAAATFGAIEEARATSDEIGIVLQKEWLPTLDDRTRPEHAAMENYGAIGLGDKFIVAGVEMDRPGDPSAPPELVINCRCAISLVEAPN